MNIETVRELEEKLEAMSRQELTKFTKQCLCQIMHGNQYMSSLQMDADVVLDLIHSEYLRRGLEKHYDMTYESVAKNPHVCNAA